MTTVFLPSILQGLNGSSHALGLAGAGHLCEYKENSASFWGHSLEGNIIYRIATTDTTFAGCAYWHTFFRANHPEGAPWPWPWMTIHIVYSIHVYPACVPWNKALHSSVNSGFLANLSKPGLQRCAMLCIVLLHRRVAKQWHKRPDEFNSKLFQTTKKLEARGEVRKLAGLY
jgi:hypothetical protein